MLLAAGALASCGLVGKKPPKKEEPSPFGPTGIPPELRAKSSQDGVPVTAGGNAAGDQPLLSFTKDEDTVFTDPDNPEAGIPQELATILANPKKGGPWLKSETLAKRQSTREGKPVLIWFTNSANSPMCKALNQELFSQHDFGNWATDNLIRLKVDASFKQKTDSSIGEDMDREARIGDYVEELKKRYKILGYPSLIVVSPGGEVVGRYRGYKRGESELMWGQLKHAVAVSDVSYKGWRKTMEAKGYREWEDRRGRKIFAKPVAYAKGRLTLVEPDGTRSATAEDKLSDKDQAWIAERRKQSS
jgi:hypothetical protein